MSNLKKDGKQRWAPSYLRRQGQVTPRQKRAIREHWETHGLTYEHGKKLDLEAAFGFPPPYVLEIGFGMGEHLLHLAQQHPETGILGIEVHKPGIGAAIAEASEPGLSNLRVIRGDGRLVLSDHIKGRIFSEIHIQCPDPWPKPVDFHRRIIQPEFVQLMASRLIQGGEFHFVTDVENYAQHVEEIFGAFSNWKSISPKSKRTETRYEKKGIAEGRSIHELSYSLKD